MKNAIITKITFSLFLVFSLNTVHGQFFKKLKKKVENAAEQAVLNKAEEKTRKETENTIDTLLNGKRRKGIDGPTSNENSNKQDRSAEEDLAAQPTLEVYSKFDFEPGENIVAYEDFSEDQIGDLPARWNTSMASEVVNLNMHEGKWMQLKLGEGSIVPDFGSSLPENFTLEYDLIINYNQDYGFKPNLLVVISDLENNKYALNDNTPGSNGASFMIEGGIHNGYMTFYKYAKDSKLNFRARKDFSQPLVDSYNGTDILHISLWRQGNRVRVYLNEEKVFDIPGAFEKTEIAKTMRFYYDINEDPTSYYIGNIRFAKGRSDIRSKLITEGKLVTYGITFNKGKATVKPESYGVLKKIASVLTDNTSLKLEIIGHTDADGSEEANQILSEKRAISVKNVLVENFKVAPDQLSTNGKGESDLLVEGNSSDAHAKNRRVEFKKL